MMNWHILPISMQKNASMVMINAEKLHDSHMLDKILHRTVGQINLPTQWMWLWIKRKVGSMNTNGLDKMWSMHTAVVAIRKQYMYSYHIFINHYIYTYTYTVYNYTYTVLHPIIVNSVSQAQFLFFFHLCIVPMMPQQQPTKWSFHTNRSWSIVQSWLFHLSICWTKRRT